MAEICTGDESKAIVGEDAEDEFDTLWWCPCGGNFVPQHHPLPDRKCEDCGLEVDVKGAPEAKDYGTITISQRPFDSWDDGVVIAWRPSPHEWYGTRKHECEAEGPYPPAHEGKRPTWFYKIDISPFRPLEHLLVTK